MKTPEEIKKGIECCFGDSDVRECEQCPYAHPIPTNTVFDLVTCDDNMEGICVDALAYIKKLEERISKQNALLAVMGLTIPEDESDENP